MAGNVVEGFEIYSKLDTKFWIHFFIHQLSLGHLMCAQHSRHWGHHSESENINPCLLEAYSLATGVLEQRKEVIWFKFKKVLLAAVWSVTCREVRTVAGVQLGATTIQAKEGGARTRDLAE